MILTFFNKINLQIFKISYKFTKILQIVFGFRLIDSFLQQS